MFAHFLLHYLCQQYFNFKIMQIESINQEINM